MAYELKVPMSDGVYGVLDTLARVQGVSVEQLVNQEKATVIAILAAAGVTWAVSKLVSAQPQEEPVERSLSLPVAGAFMYPWFPNAWSQQGFDPFTRYTPSMGLYDSDDPGVVQQQLIWAREARLDAFITSWWGQGHHTDEAFASILGIAEGLDPGFRFTIYHEQEGQGNPSVLELTNDLVYLWNNYMQRVNWLWVDGRPVVWSYGGATATEQEESCEMIDRWQQAASEFATLTGQQVYVVLKVFQGFEECRNPGFPDAWHQYAPASQPFAEEPGSVVISPGFWRVDEEPRLERDPAAFRQRVRDMVESEQPWWVVNSWNEWGESTSVEPAEEFGATYIAILRDEIPVRD